MIRIMHRSAGSATIAWLLNGAVSLSDLAGVLKTYSPSTASSTYFGTKLRNDEQPSVKDLPFADDIVDIFGNQ
jgi:hypothetical protein